MGCLAECWPGIAVPLFLAGPTHADTYLYVSFHVWSVAKLSCGFGYVAVAGVWQVRDGSQFVCRDNQSRPVEHHHMLPLYVSIHIWLSNFLKSNAPDAFDKELTCFPDLMTSIVSVYLVSPAGSILVNELSKRRKLVFQFYSAGCRGQRPGPWKGRRQCDVFSLVSI